MFRQSRSNHADDAYDRRDLWRRLLIHFRHKNATARTSIWWRRTKSGLQATSEAFSSIRDIIIYQSAGYFENRFSGASERYNAAQAYSLYYSARVPRFPIIEMTGFAALIGLALYLHGSGAGESPAGHVIPLIALFAVAGYKILPAAQNLYSALNSLRFNSAALSTVADGIALAPIIRVSNPVAEIEITFSREIEVKISAEFLRRKKFVRSAYLRDVNCTTVGVNSLAGRYRSSASGEKHISLICWPDRCSPWKGNILVDGQAVGRWANALSRKKSQVAKMYAQEFTFWTDR